MNFAGVFTALVTPFKNNKVDYVSLEKLLKQQINGGVKKFVVNGTTAESPTLHEEESLDVLRFVLEKAKGCTIVFGSGNNSTEKTISFSRKAVEIGAHGLLLVVPYYNKPPQAGLLEHFKQIAVNVQTPQILYNVPSRTITGLEVDTIVELSQIKNIIGIKEATGKLDFDAQIISLCKKDFVVLSGDDETCLTLAKNGGQGVISVCSHIMPKSLTTWFQDPQNEGYHAEFKESIPLIQSLYISTNPIPVKAALHIMGIIDSDEMRLPLCRLTAEQKKLLESQLKTYERFLT